ncbi:MAG: 50S ribosomal protein L30 [Fibrobacteria bacterium]|nr:50S ribosomal protein L30 [Fibrobacteria bacterium]
MASKIKITQKKGLIRTLPKQRSTMEALGLHGIGKSVVKVHTPSISGMLKIVSHLVSTEEVE